MAVEITPEKLASSGTEDGEQSALFLYALAPAYREARGKRDHLWALLYAIPNGGLRASATAARMAATGARRGFPDIGLPVPCARYAGLYIELKRLASYGKRAGVTNDDQDRWHRLLREQGYCVAVCYGWQDARLTIEAYLG